MWEREREYQRYRVWQRQIGHVFQNVSTVRKNKGKKSLKAAATASTAGLRNIVYMTCLGKNNRGESDLVLFYHMSSSSFAFPATTHSNTKETW